MASPQTPDPSEIRRRGRQRLIGAVAIALLLIVFVPMLLDSEPRPSRDESKLEIPPRENAPPLPAPKAEAPPATEAKKAVATAEVKPLESKPAAKLAAAEPPKAGAQSPPSFAIQVGAFRDEAKLAQVRDKLTAANIKTYTEPSGDLTRLRVGPFPNREAAEKSLGAVRLTVPDAKVVPLQ